MLLQFEAEVYNPPDIFPLIPIVNESCNIEHCVNNMMVSQCSELELRSKICKSIQPPDPIDTYLFQALKIKEIIFWMIWNITIVNTTHNVARLVYYNS